MLDVGSADENHEPSGHNRQGHQGRGEHRRGAGAETGIVTFI